MHCGGGTLTYVVFFTLHVVGEGTAAELVGAKEAEVAGDLSGDGGGQALEETLRAFVLHDGFHHRPHRAAGRGRGGKNQKTEFIPSVADSFNRCLSFGPRNRNVPTTHTES